MPTDCEPCPGNRNATFERPKAGRLCAEPRPGLGVEPERPVPEVEHRVRGLDADRRRQDAMVECERRVEQAGEPRRALGVADLRLDGADHAAPRPRAGLAEEPG